MHILCQPNTVCTINCLCDKHIEIYSYVYFLNIQQLEYLEHHFMKNSFETIFTHYSAYLAK